MTATTSTSVSNDNKTILCTPIVRYLGQNKNPNQWKVSVLIVSKKLGKNKFLCPHASSIHYDILYRINKIAFERFFVILPQLKQEKLIRYKIYNRNYSIRIPGQNDPMKMAFFSCNGFQYETDKKKMKGIQNIWGDYNSVNKKNPPHLMIFGGDQVYCDPVFSTPSIKKWLKLPEKEKLGAKFTHKMNKDVSNYYLQKYIDKFKKNGNFAKALNKSPTIMMWDDHDIFDGWGSFPDNFQKSPVFKGIYKIAKTFYLLFQQQVNPKSPYKSGSFLGTQSFSTLNQINDIAILSVDTRSRRSKTVILPKEAWDEIFLALIKLPKNCKHLFVSLSVPIIYPNFGLLESIFSQVNSYRSTIEKWLIKPLKQMIMSKQGTVDLDDDVNDHWTHKLHRQERKRVIIRLQELAKTKGLRITFLSGDVHLGGAGVLRNPNIQKKYDPNYMVNFISSPMGNKPSGKFMSQVLSTLLNKTESFSSHILGKMIPIKRIGKAEETTFISKRNWGEIKYDPKTEMTLAQLYVESSKLQKNSRRKVIRYAINIPNLHKAPIKQNTVAPSKSCVLL